MQSLFRKKDLNIHLFNKDEHKRCMALRGTAFSNQAICSVSEKSTRPHGDAPDRKLQGCF